MSPTIFASLPPWVAPVGGFFAALIFILLFALLLQAMLSRKRLRQKETLKNWVFKPAYTQQVLRQYPHLSGHEVGMAFELLRLYFEVCWQYKNKSVAMPSKLVGSCWRAFVLDTRMYRQFCVAVYGDFLHYEPSLEVAQSSQSQAAEFDPSIEKANVNKSSSAEDYTQLLATALAFQGSFDLINKVTPVNQAATDLLREGTVFVPNLFTIDQAMDITDGNVYSNEFLTLLARFGAKSKISAMAELDFATINSTNDLGDAGSSASDCGGSD